MRSAQSGISEVSATREQAMADFKARWLASIN
jgi:hypothetical protein